MRISVVVPCFNEEAGLEDLYAALTRTLPALGEDYEVLLVDDGSTDGTLPLLRLLAQRDQRFKYLALSRNFGKEAAMLAGLGHATGDLVAIMDADLQHPPELLERMVGLIGAGYDQVIARRSRRGESPVRKLVSTLYYKLINKVIDVELQNGVGDFRVLSKRAVQALLSLGEYNRFSKGLFSWIGFDTAVIDYDNVLRQNGRSSWTFRKLFNYGIDGVVSFNSKPLRVAIYLGALVTAVAFGYAIWVLAHAVRHGVDVPGYVTLMCGVLVLGGLQLLFLGVIGEYVGRIYFETKRRPHFLVKESAGAGHTPVTLPLGPEVAEHAAEAMGKVVIGPFTERTTR
ncbi:glycosyltransferase involved in cell wall biosynthesis [Saccharothrix tamanrassetensis]|uniref:Glycosyltransferase involved in cell wall biosynthesis n=1 Tax=Saccharothrix tamanrassetensis TaxID=1051531 RepID=A0A841C508_9PSEU|nr:glycosyltransferase family 2 protein [Saccharothrix tamanrassetensis]MBB5953612.1 glycosyltransferase involved in cell wall biosynthesis [Saccharothrix tamanrassetensis]